MSHLESTQNPIWSREQGGMLTRCSTSRSLHHSPCDDIQISRLWKGSHEPYGVAWPNLT